MGAEEFQKKGTRARSQKIAPWDQRAMQQTTMTTMMQGRREKGMRTGKGKEADHGSLVKGSLWTMRRSWTLLSIICLTQVCQLCTATLSPGLHDKLTSPDELVQSTAMEWVLTFLEFAQTTVVAFMPRIVPAILPNLASQS